MKLYKIALRNITRNKRRTISTTLSIFIALAFSIFIRSLQEGTYNAMISQSIGETYGYLQIQGKDYFDDPSIDNSIEYSDELLQKIRSTEGVKSVSPHIQTGALVSSGNKSKPVMVMSIYPNSSDTNFINHMELISGKMLSREDNAVLLSSQLAKYLNINTGDTIVLIGQGYHGYSAAGLFPVKGTLNSPNVQINNKLICMSVKGMQQWLNLPNLINYIAIDITNAKYLNSVQKNIEKKISGSSLIIKNWEEINPDIKRGINADRNGGKAIIYLLYIIVFFGILGTTLMTINERKKEFCVNMAIGMKRNQIKKIIFIEMMATCFLGIILALIIDIPLILYLTINPIVFTGNTAAAFMKLGYAPIMPCGGLNPFIWYQTGYVILMVSIAVMFSFRKINKLKISESLHIS